MSDHFTTFIPADPRFVPSEKAQHAAAALLQDLAPDAEDVSSEVEDAVVFRDCGENFERVTQSTLSRIARRAPFHYAMGLGKENHWPGQETWDTRGLPGQVGPRFSEHNQRNFYAYWAHLMRGGRA